MPSPSTPQRHPPGQGSLSTRARPRPEPCVGPGGAAGSRTCLLGAVRTLERRRDSRAPGARRGPAGTEGDTPRAGVEVGLAKAAGLRRPPEAARPGARVPAGRDPAARLCTNFPGAGEGRPSGAGPGRAGPGLTCAQVVVDPQGHPQDVDQEEHEEEPHGPQIGPRPHDAGLELLQEARARLGHLPALLRAAAALAVGRDDSPARGTARAAAAARARRPRSSPGARMRRESARPALRAPAGGLRGAVTWARSLHSPGPFILLVLVF